MSGKKSFWVKVAAMFLALVLIVPVMAACSDDNETTTVTVTKTVTGTPTVTPPATTPAATTPPATTPAATTPPATAPAATTPPASKGPVKIGVVGAWTGPAAVASFLADNAIKALQLYVKEQGGILGGRPVEFIKYDGGGEVGQVVRQFAKAADQDKVSIVLGGMTGGEIVACTEEAQKYRVPYISAAALPESIADYTYTIRGGGYNPKLQPAMFAKFIIDQLKPKTALFLTDNEASRRMSSDTLNNLLVAAGVKVLDRIYPSSTTMDFSSYLTRIKYANPDVLLIDFGNAGAFGSLMQEAMSQGGWGNMKVCDVSAIGSFPSFLQIPSMEGTYHCIFFQPGLPYPGSKLMDRLYKEGAGWSIIGQDALYYMQMMAALAAVEGAGSTDRDAIQRYMRSGNLTYEGPLGTVRVGTDGEISYRAMVAKVVGGQFVTEPSTLP